MKNRQLGFAESAAILGEYGIPVLGRAVRTREDALEGAKNLGYPVVIKADVSDIVHKTDVGAVILDIPDEKELEKAYDALLENVRRAGARGDVSVLVQKMVKPGFEMLVGAKQDRCFGPVTMVGHGGRFVELWKDAAPAVGALSRGDVERMLGKTKSDIVLKGFRGPALDRDNLIDLVMKVSTMMEERPQINELDLNPVIVYEKGFAIVDARVIVGDPVAHSRAQDLSTERMKNLDAILSPKSVAVVGASKAGSIGGIIFKNSSRIDKLYPVNPGRKSLLGRKCYPTLESLPETPDLAVFALGAEASIASFKEYAALGGRGAIIVSDGFAEIGRSDLEKELHEAAEAHGVVYIGPNCLGVVDNFSGLNTLFVPGRRTGVRSEPSGLGVISQSGGIGLELLEMLDADNLSVGQWVSCGNASGIAISEILAHMGEDPRINTIAVYIEGLRNGLRFMEVGKKVAAKKPVIVIKGGTGGGAAKTMSHTASLAGSFEAFKAACEQAGFFLIEELTEDPKILINVLSLLATQPPAEGNRIAVVSVGGGAAILLADQLTEEGMVLADFAPETRARFAKLLSKKIQAASPAERERIRKQISENPLDLFGDCDDDMLLEALLALNDDPNTDIILAAIYFQVPYLSEYIAERLLDIHGELRKPVILSPRGYSRHVWNTRAFLTANDFQTYTVPMVKPLSIALDIWKRYGDVRQTGRAKTSH